MSADSGADRFVAKTCLLVLFVGVLALCAGKGITPLLVGCVVCYGLLLFFKSIQS